MVEYTAVVGDRPEYDSAGIVNTAAGHSAVALLTGNAYIILLIFIAAVTERNTCTRKTLDTVCAKILKEHCTQCGAVVTIAGDMRQCAAVMVQCRTYLAGDQILCTDPFRSVIFMGTVQTG